jgi:hypothetical protein
VVALGASNLTRGFQPLVAAARETWGPDVEVLAALGHGRSYGGRSFFLGRTLPGILDSGIWRQLERLQAAPARALVTDVGNDILYGHSAAQTLAWVEEAVDRLLALTPDVVLSALPMASVRRLSNARFLLFRTLLVPGCRIPLARIVETAADVDAGLARLAGARGLRLQPQRAEWYGVDPMHIRPSAWRAAWREILLGVPDPGAAGGAAGPGARREALQLYRLRPERRWMLGREQITRQEGVRLNAGGRVWLY